MLADASADVLVGVFLVFLWGVAFVGLVFWFYVLYLAATQETDKNNARLLWVLIILVTGTIGALVYYFARYRPRVRRTRHKTGGDVRDQLLDRRLHRPPRR
jgi:hypothetical protein